METFNNQFRVFDRGAKRYRKRNNPSFSDLVNHVDKRHNRRKKQAQPRKQLRVNALELATAKDQQLSRWKENVNNPMCLCCGKAVETTMHITRWSDPNRRQMFQRSASNLTTWMAECLVDPVLVDMVEQYLWAQGEKTMVNCLTLHTPEFVRLAEESDGLHWDSFLEGRISTR